MEGNDLLDAGKFKEAEEYHLRKEEYTQAAFACVLAKDLDSASEHIASAPSSVAESWVKFLVPFLDSGRLKSDKLAGYLSMRLFMESTLTYFIKFSLDEYLNLFIDNAKKFEEAFPDIYRSIGIAFLVSEDYVQARSFLEKALEWHPGDMEAVYRIAESHYFQGDNKSAEKYFSKLLSHIPEHISSKKYLEKIHNS